MFSAVHKTSDDLKAISQIQDQHRNVAAVGGGLDDPELILLAPAVLQAHKFHGDALPSSSLDDPPSPALKRGRSVLKTHLETNRTPFLKGHADQDSLVILKERREMPCGFTKGK